ncbi:MAG: polysaccharide deacetylase [Clostridium sp.]|jgi:peptidoglycan/xylan/chitin deacetylase (PgdA/CDA1 family)|nr:polysaccharide deacetylase [Clostridium sp.]
MKNNSKSIKLSKLAITLISITIVLVVVGIVSIIVNISNNGQTVQANYIEKDNDSNKTNAQEENADSSKQEKEKSSDTKIESALYIENYIDQQVKAEMPEGADGKKVVYLTFDDGPSTTVTPRILDILEHEGVDATFFVVGKYVDEQKELVKREAEEGNAVAIHSYTHDYNYLYPGGKINVDNCISDFEKTSDSIKSILGQDYKIRALRLPGGYYSWNKNDPANAQAVIDKMHEKDWHQIEWNCLSGDAEGNAPKTAEQLYQETVQTVGTREKAVILMHDTYQKEATAEALPRIIEYLKQQGYEFKTIR